MRLLAILLAVLRLPTGRAQILNSLTNASPLTVLPANFTPPNLLIPGIAPPIAIASLSFEQRRSLLYLFARLNQAEAAEELGRAILAESPGDKQTLLTLASMYLDRKDPVNTLRMAKALLAHHPDDHQARYFEAAALLLSKQAPAAERILQDVKRTHFPKQWFPYQTDLATAAVAAGDWRTAVTACQEVLRQHDISEKLRANVRHTLETLYRDHLPRFSAESTGTLLAPGSVFRSSAEHRQHIAEDHKLFVRYQRYDTHLLAAPIAGIAQRSAQAQDAGIGLESTLSKNWRTEAWVGAGNPGPVGALSLHYLPGNASQWTVAFEGNSHSTDSLLLESLDGREQRGTLRGTFPVTSRVSFTAEAYGRHLHVDGESLGHGAGATWALDHLILRDTPELHAGYRGTYSAFSLTTANTQIVEPAVRPDATPAQREALLRGLVLEELHREGIYLLWKDRIIEPLFYRLVTTLEYSFELDTIVYGASAGFHFYPRKSIEMSGEGGYLSSATSGDLNSDQWQFNVALKYWF